MEKYIKASKVLRHYKKVVSLQTKYLRPYYTMTKFNSRHTLAAFLSIDFQFEPSAIPGDVNGDGIVSVSDISEIVNAIFR